MKYFKIEKVSSQYRDLNEEIQDRFRPYDGVDDLPHRRCPAMPEEELADYDFYLSWVPKVKEEIINEGVCKRYWEARIKKEYESDSEDEASDYKDERISKVRDFLDSVDLTSLSTMLYSSAIDFEFTVFSGKEDKQAYQPLLSYECVQAVFNNASMWFNCLVPLPYDATFRLDALLDCLEFFMGHRYGKFQLPDVYKIEVL